MEVSVIVVMNEEATEAQKQSVTERLKGMGFAVHRDDGAKHSVLGVIGDTRKIDPRDLEIEDGVFEVLRVTEPYKLASRAFHPKDTIVEIGDVRFGGAVGIEIAQEVDLPPVVVAA